MIGICLNQDFREAATWSIISERIEPWLGDFPDVSSWRALANSPEEKFSEIYLSGSAGIFQS